MYNAAVRAALEAEREQLRGNRARCGCGAEVQWRYGPGYAVAVEVGASGTCWPVHRCTPANVDAIDPPADRVRILASRKADERPTYWRH